MLSSLDQIKAQLGVTDTSLDAILSQLLPQSDQLIKTWLRHPVEQAVYTDYLDGTNTPWLRLKYPYVSSVASVYVDSQGNFGQTPGAFGSATLLTVGIDYALKIDQPDGVTSKCGLLYRINAVWPPGFRYVRGLLATPQGQLPGCIQVSYTAGFSVIPDDLAWACNQLVAGLFRIRTGRSFESEGFEDANYQANVPKTPWECLEGLKPMLAPYKVLRL